MKRIWLFGLCLTLAACGGRSERAERDPGPLDGVRGFLSTAFSADDAEAAPDGGGLCGDPRIVGEPAGAVPGPGACGIGAAVRVSAVSGVRLTQQALLECSTARALRSWVDDSAKPAIGTRGGGLAELQVAAHYVCRTRNHQPGAKISEHGKGRAIDLSAFRLADGSEIDVLTGWDRGADGRVLRQMRDGACGPFGTVLGPGSDRWHDDHFHFDVAAYRGGPYCR